MKIFSLNQENQLKRCCNLLLLSPTKLFSIVFRLLWGTVTAVHPPFLLLFLFVLCAHTFPISSVVVVSDGFVIKSTALVQQVIRSENTAGATASVCGMSSGHAKCQMRGFMEEVLHQEKRWREGGSSDYQMSIRSVYVCV